MSRPLSRYIFQQKAGKLSISFISQDTEVMNNTFKYHKKIPTPSVVGVERVK